MKHEIELHRSNGFYCSVTGEFSICEDGIEEFANLKDICGGIFPQRIYLIGHARDPGDPDSVKVGAWWHKSRLIINGKLCHVESNFASWIRNHKITWLTLEVDDSNPPAHKRLECALYLDRECIREVSGKGYKRARVGALEFSPDGAFVNKEAIIFPHPYEEWGRVVAFRVFDAVSHESWLHGEFTKPSFVFKDGPVQFNKGAFVLRLEDV